MVKNIFVYDTQKDSLVYIKCHLVLLFFEAMYMVPTKSHT